MIKDMFSLREKLERYIKQNPPKKPDGNPTTDFSNGRGAMATEVIQELDRIFYAYDVFNHVTRN